MLRVFKKKNIKICPVSHLPFYGGHLIIIGFQFFLKEIFNLKIEKYTALFKIVFLT